MSQSPDAPSLDESLGSAQMRYVDAYNYVFLNPNWAMNLLLCALCQLIPVVGPIVMMGYQFEIIQTLLQHRGGAYPDFDFNQFVEYLKRGVWPFLVSLVVGAVVSVPLTALCGLLSVASAIVGGRGSPLMGIMGMGAGAVTTGAGLVIISFLIVPIFLRAGLQQDFAGAFDLAYAKQFIQTMWKEMIVGALFMVGSGIVVSAAGMLICCVGVYLSAALIMLAQAHVYYQLYVVYLTRGGSPIPLKPATAGPQVR